ncbi:MAG: TIM barrel protein [Clostridia bacterium]|nr:TIM barrel protein [Clostridia bacterium]
MAEGKIFGVSSAHFFYNSPKYAFKKCKEWGFGRLEFFSPRLTTDDYLEVADLSLETDIIVDYHPPYMNEFDWGKVNITQGIKSIGKIVKVASLMNAKHIIIHMGTYLISREKSLANFTAIVTQIIPKFEEEGLYLCVEDFTLCHYDHVLGDRVEDFDYLFDQVDSKFVGLTIDYGHAHVTGNTFEYLRRFGNRLLHVHIQDNDGIDDQHKDVGKGTINWEEVLKATVQTGFKGPYIIECSPGIIESRERIKSILENISS